MFCVGLTGNIASGKTTAANYFAEHGVSVIHADQIARELTTRESPVFSSLIEHFGPQAIASDGELNRAYLRQLIFKEPQEKLWLENLLHPLIFKTIEQRIPLLTGPYCVIEIPLLINKNLYPYLQRILLIVAEQKIQINRVKLRDNCTEEIALSILAGQSDNALHMEVADDLIENNGTKEELFKKLYLLHLHYLSLAKKETPTL